jgi:hypothetical protein
MGLQVDFGVFGDARPGERVSFPGSYKVLLKHGVSRICVAVYSALKSGDEPAPSPNSCAGLHEVIEVLEHELPASDTLNNFPV